MMKNLFIKYFTLYYVVNKKYGFKGTAVLRANTGISFDLSLIIFFLGSFIAPGWPAFFSAIILFTLSFIFCNIFFFKNKSVIMSKVKEYWKMKYPLIRILIQLIFTMIITYIALENCIGHWTELRIFDLVLKP